MIYEWLLFFCISIFKMKMTTELIKLELCGNLADSIELAKTCRSYHFSTQAVG